MEASKPMSGVPWPHAVSLVLAAQEPHQRDWAVAAAIEIARKLAARSKVVLVDTGAGGASLADKLGVGHEGGIADVLFRGASFSVVAQRPAAETFFFLPLGPSAPPPEVLFQHPRWLKIAKRLRDANAHLLTFVSAEDWFTSGPISGFESCIILNGSGQEVELPAGARRFAEFLAPPGVRESTVSPEPDGVDAVDEAEAPAVVGREAEAVEPGAPSDGESAARFSGVAATFGRVPVVLGVSEPENGSASSAWDSLDRWRSRVRLSRLGPLGRRIAAAGVVVAAVVTVVVIWAAFSVGGGPDEPTVFQAAAETTAVADVASDPVPPPPADEDRRGGRPGGVGLPYSVAIASYSSFEDALARQKRLARNELPVYVAPTPVRGVVYYRVFAGLLAERSEAEALMAQLVREGVKDTVRAWDVRQAQFAFSFGTFESTREAKTKLEELLQQGIHAYTVPVGGGAADAQVAYHVYSGGYETREAAAPLREQIETAGLSAELVERVGLQER